MNEKKETKVNAEVKSSFTGKTIETMIKDLIIGDSKKLNVYSLDNTLEKGIEDMLNLGKESKPLSTSIHDAYSNTLSATGGADRVESFSSYGFNNNTLNWPLWLALYNDSWVFRRAIDKPAQDEANCGFTLHGNEDYTRIYKAYDQNKFDLIQLLQWGALFGGSIAVMLIDGISDEEMSKPINPLKIKGKRLRLYVTDRWYGVSVVGTDTVTSMKDIDFGKPAMYGVSFADGKSINIHHSYILRYEHRTAPKLVKCGQLQGWGYAEGSHIINELSRDDQLKASITSLINKSLIEVIQMAGMRGVFMGTDEANEEQLRKRLEMVNWGRSYNSLTFLDKDDTYQQFQMTALSGLSQLLETNMWLVAAALEMQGILFGDLKGGLSQESDALERYAITIMNRCNSYYRPVLQKFLTILFMIYGVEGTPDFDFNSLVAIKVNNEKMDSIDKFSNILSKMTGDGIISKYQAAMSLKNYMNNNALSVDFTEEEMNKLKFQEELEILDVYSQRNKQASGTDIFKSQFPNGSEETQLPDKLSYLQEEMVGGENKQEVQPQEEIAPEGGITNEEPNGGETPEE